MARLSKIAGGNAAWGVYLAVLAIVTAAAWIRDAGDQVRFAAVATPSILATAAGCGVTVAALTLFRSSLPLSLRWFGLVAGAYAVLAFAGGALAATPLGDLLARGSFWRQLPLVLQGAFVGAFVLVPGGLVAAAVRIGLRRPRDGSRIRLLQQGLALALTLVLFLSALPGRSTSPSEVARQAAAAPPGAEQVPTAQTSNEVDPVVLLDAADATASRVERARWDVEERADALADGLDAAFALVRDEIGYEPYAGVLRGAQTTYSTRAGNAADRAILLAELLNHHGTRTRYAIGTLPAERQQRLLMRVFEQSPALGSLPDGKPGSLQMRLFERANRDYQRVRAALGDHLAPVSIPSRAEVLAELNPHIWVQAEKDGAWIDLDPSFIESRVGQAFAATERTVDSLPAEFYQQVTTRVVCEQFVDGAVVPLTLLEVVRPAVELNHVQTAVFHVQAQGVAGLGGAMAAAFGRKADRWTPMLWIEGVTTQGTSFDADSPGFVAEWLEFELSWPGGRREVTRRPLADRGGAAWRERVPLDRDTLQPLARNDQGALDMQAVHNVWFSAGQFNLADYVDALEELLLETAQRTSAAGSEGVSPAADFGQSLWPFAMHNLSAMIWTDHLSLPSVNDAAGVRLFQDSLRISIFTTGPSAGEHVRVVTDLRRDDLRGLAVEGAERTLAERKLRFGLLQGALEHEFMVDFAVGFSGDASGVSSTSSELSGRDLSAFAPADSSRLESHLGPSVRVRRALLDQSSVVTAPAGLDAHGAWWELKAGTGDTRAVGGPGLHNGLLDLLGKGAKQMNGLTPPKAYDGRTRAEWVAERNAKYHDMIRKRNLANPNRHKPAARNPARAQGQGGGGMEYAVVLVVSTIAGMAVWLMSAWLEAKLYAEILDVIDWIKDGGFRRAVGR